MHEDQGSNIRANIQFFSALDCEKFLRQMTGCVLDQRRLHVQRLELSRVLCSAVPTKPDQAIMLMNKYFTSLGWSSSVVDLQRVSLRQIDQGERHSSDSDEAEFEACYAARVAVQCGDVRVQGESRGRWAGATAAAAIRVAGKTAVSNAVRAALSQLAIVRVGENVMLEVIEDPMPAWSRGDADPR
jgi:hypothetical protein